MCIAHVQLLPLPALTIGITNQSVLPVQPGHGFRFFPFTVLTSQQRLLESSPPTTARPSLSSNSSLSLAPFSATVLRDLHMPQGLAGLQPGILQDVSNPVSGFTTITHLQDVFILGLSVQLPGRGQQTWGRDGRRETWAPRAPRATSVGVSWRVTFKSLIRILVFGEWEL